MHSGNKKTTTEIISDKMWQFLSSPMQHAVLWLEASRGLWLTKIV